MGLFLNLSLLLSSFCFFVLFVFYAPLSLIICCCCFPLHHLSYHLLPLHLLSHCSPSSFSHPLPLSLSPAPAGKSLWRWIWSQFVSTATNACQMTWNAAWPSVNATLKRKRRNYWSPCVCDPLFLLCSHFHCSSFGQFLSALLFL